MKGQDFIKSPKTPSTNAFNDAGAKVSFRPMLHCYLRVRSHERRNELIPVWDFKPAWKQVLFTWLFISAAFQNDPIYRRTCVGVSFRVVFTWYFITRNEILFLWVLNEFQTRMRTQYPTRLSLFISLRVNFVHMKISCLFKISFRSKWPIWNPYRFEFHTAFMWTQVKSWLNTKLNIFNRNEISYQFQFISPLMWTYS